MTHHASRFTLIAAASLLTACAIGSPFEDGPAAEVTPASGTYIVGVTHLRWKDVDGAKDILFAHSDILVDKIRQAPGNVGHAMRRKLIARDAWTLSVWLDRESMGNFVASPEHIDAIIDMLPVSEFARTVTFEIDADEGVPSWDRALAELEDNGVER